MCPIHGDRGGSRTNVRSICDQTEHTEPIGNRSVNCTIGSLKMAELSPTSPNIPDHVYEQPDCITRSLPNRSWNFTDQPEQFPFCTIDPNLFRSIHDRIGQIWIYIKSCCASKKIICKIELVQTASWMYTLLWLLQGLIDLTGRWIWREWGIFWLWSSSRTTEEQQAWSEWWLKSWLQRRTFLGQYTRLMEEMRRKDIPCYTNYMEYATCSWGKWWQTCCN